jgi:PAS domain S-box-containing protein
MVQLQKEIFKPPSRGQSLNPALKIALIYFVVSSLWIFFSDRLLELTAENLTNYSHFQTIKGLGFITITTILIFWLVYRKIKEKNKMIETIEKNEQKYKAFINETMEGIYRIEVTEPIPINLPVEEQIKLIYERAYLTEYNKAFAEIYGYDHEELKNMKLPDFHKLVSSKESKNFVKKFIDSGYQLKNSLNEEKRKDGKSIILSKNITGILINNYLYSAWGSQSDVTERKKYEQQLIEAKKHAEESDQLKNAFLANMSHEIRTPLNGIMGFSQLLSKEDLKPVHKEKYISIIKNNGKQLLNIINDILDISKIEAKQINVYETEFSLNELIKEIKTLYINDEQRNKKKLGLHSHIGLPDNKDNIIADRERLMQIIQNLINNSIKFTSEGQIDFGYTKKGSELEFFVKDTGVGISEGKQESIFNRFQQDQAIYPHPDGGTGLGLSISKGLLELMDGEIWVKSTPGNGSTFYFTITYKPANNKGEKEEFNNSEKILSDKTILIVEDDKNSVELFKAIMKDHDLKILYAADGFEALELFKQNPDISMVLMDIRLPKLDGLETTRKLKKIRSDVPVIAQSAYVMAEDKKASRNAGCEDFIAKPLEEEKLLELIKKYLP